MPKKPVHEEELANNKPERTELFMKEVFRLIDDLEITPKDATGILTAVIHIQVASAISHAKNE